LKTPGKKRQKHSPDVVFVDDFDKCVIRNTKRVGFMWRKCQLREILVERADIVTRRSRYLKEVKKCRSNGPLMFYTHKTWTDSNLTFRKCWQEDEVMVVLTQKLKKLENHLKIHTHVNLGNRFIMLHVGGVGGFLPPCTYHLQGWT